MKYCIQHLVWIFTHFMLLASFLAPKNIRKPKIFWYFQGVQEETTNIKRVNYPSPPVWLCTRERERKGERETERETERQRQRETDRERQRETERELSLKGRISKRVIEENKARQVFRKTNFNETMSKKCSFFGKLDVLFFL